MKTATATVPFWARLRGSGFKTRLLNPRDELWDRRLGIATFGFVPAVGEPDHDAWQGHYQPTSYKDLFRMLRHLGVGADDVFYDLGCGLGRTVFAAHRLGARRAVGVEVNGPLVRACRENLVRSGADPRAVAFVECFAQDCSYADATVLFLFHPFGRGTLQTVLERVGRDLAAAPRRLRLVYFNAVADDILEGCGFLRRTDRWAAGQGWSPTSGRYDASFWESSPAADGR